MKKKFMKDELNLFFLILLISFVTNLTLAQENKVKIQFSILDENGNFFDDLKDSDIQISKNSITSLKLNTESSLDIGIMIDASASQEGTLPFEKKVAESFIDSILQSKKDKVSVIKFTGVVSLEQDLTNDFQKAKEQIGKIEFEPPSGYISGGTVVATTPSPNKKQIAQGSTSIWESIKQVLEAFSKVQTNNSRRAIILISDGVNTYGDVKLKEVINFSVKKKIPIYAIGIGDEFYGGIDKKTLKKITEETGGISVIPNKKLENLPQQLKIIEQSLRSNYEVIYTPNLVNSKDKLQELKVEIVNPELRKRKLQIIQPKGFYF